MCGFVYECASIRDRWMLFHLLKCDMCQEEEEEEEREGLEYICTKVSLNITTGPVKRLA